MAGVLSGRSSQAMTRTSSSAVLFVILLVSYTARSGWTQESKGIVGESIQSCVGCELFIAVIVTLVTVCTRVGV